MHDVSASSAGLNYFISAPSFLRNQKLQMINKNHKGFLCLLLCYWHGGSAQWNKTEQEVIHNMWYNGHCNAQISCQTDEHLFRVQCVELTATAGMQHLMSSNLNWMSAEQKQGDSGCRNVFNIVQIIKSNFVVLCAAADMNINRLKYLLGIYSTYAWFIIIGNISEYLSNFSVFFRLLIGAKKKTKCRAKLLCSRLIKSPNPPVWLTNSPSGQDGMADLSNIWNAEQR